MSDTTAAKGLNDAQSLQLLIDAVVDYALYMLDPTGVVTSWNSGAGRIKGYAAGEILGQHFSRFYTEQDRAAGLPALALRTAAAEGRYEAEGWRVRNDGSVFWANVVIDPIRDSDGTLVGFAKITRDITERRDAQLALQKAQAQAAHMQKMEALGQLTGGVAHDFNNLLMIVSGHVQTLKKLVADDRRGTRAAEAIEMAARSGASLTRQLLSFSRRQILKPTTVAIGALVAGVRPMLETTIGSRVSLVQDTGTAPLLVRVDPSELELALINLVLNARDAMADGGTITIAAADAAFAPGERPDALIGEFVALAISDTGGGIAPDLLPRVFDPFFTTKEGTKGTGLGLSQVHGFAHQSGGTVTIDSTLGRGTRVTLYLPRAVDPGETEPGLSAPVPEKARVLLVEDNPDVAEASAVLIEQLGYEVRRAGDAPGALAALDRDEFDLVISDIVMAGPMDGLGLARAIRARRPDLPVLLVTGYSAAVALAEPEFPVLRKPYQLAELGRAVAGLLGGRP